MLVEQAIFTSARTIYAKGYQLVSRSPGIDERLAQTLATWSPSHDSLLSKEPDASSLNCFWTDDEQLVLSRTVYAGSEYSDRGGFRTLTCMLVMQRPQLEGFHDNPLLAAQMALALGHLRVFQEPKAELQRAEIPQRTSLRGDVLKGAGNAPEAILVDATQSIRNGNRVAVVGCKDPLSLVWRLSEALATSTHPRFSFTTGLKPSVQRPFQLQFLPVCDDALRRQLGALGIDCIGSRS